MTPSPFLIQLALLFLPGVMWTHIDAKFGSRSELTQIEFLFRALLFGLASYLGAYVAYWILGFDFAIPDFEAVQTKNVLSSDIIKQIAVATVIGLIMSVAWLYGIRFRLLARVLRRIGATTTFGDEDVWDYVFNSNDPLTGYINFRDFENEVIYTGFVESFSDTGKLRELVLTEVEVYNFDGERAFSVPRLYISRKSDCMHIEFPATDANIKGPTNDRKSIPPQGSPSSTSQ